MRSGKNVETGKSGRKGLLARLARDTAGNTLAIVGAALVPLTAMIGSGVDMSRAYMAKNRMQSACDAAALAGRRAMQNDDLSAAVQAEALRYFEFNFPDGMYGTQPITPVVTKPRSGTVRVVAATALPTSIMHLFGFDTLPLDVECDASLNFVNTDVMLVLDVTGSMAWNASGSQRNNVPDEDQRIEALREAVMALYTELKPVQDQLAANDMRLRYGAVPYSSSVNVGALLSAGHIANSAVYQSRTPIYRVGNATVQTFDGLTEAQCAAKQTLPYTNLSIPASGSISGATVDFDEGRWRRSNGNWVWEPSECEVTTATYQRAATANFAFWLHEPRTLDTSNYKTFANNVPLPTRTPGNNTNASVWNGCIEERTTVATIDEDTGLAIPAGAIDLDVNLVPTQESERWRPMWQQVVYARRDAGNDPTDQNSRGAVSASGACPAAAEDLDVFTEERMQTFVDGLDPVGSTYHDIGLLWGARMISSGGVFADSPDTFNGMPVMRHIIFMTDGELAPTASTYSAYGIEYMDQRVTGVSNITNGNVSNDAVTESHRQRFRMICNRLRSMNVSVWVIAFGGDTALTDDMSNCASNPTQASHANDKADLIARFRQIGNQIGALRLTQ